MLILTLQRVTLVVIILAMLAVEYGLIIDNRTFAILAGVLLAVVVLLPLTAVIQEDRLWMRNKRAWEVAYAKATQDRLR